jgi:hypothetical protein
MVFAPEKSELLHFSGSGAAITLPLRLGDKEIQPSHEARLLGVWLNRRLNWESHLIKIKTKMATQMLAFSKLIALAWGTSVPRPRQIYAVVIRSVLAYNALNWHKIGEGLKELLKVITLTQNKCLRIMSDAYKATPIRYLESEIAIPPLDFYFDKWMAMSGEALLSE